MVYLCSLPFFAQCPVLANLSRKDNATDIFQSYDGCLFPRKLSVLVILIDTRLISLYPLIWLQFFTFFLLRQKEYIPRVFRRMWALYSDFYCASKKSRIFGFSDTYQHNIHRQFDVRLPDSDFSIQILEPRPSGNCLRTDNAEECRGRA